MEELFEGLAKTIFTGVSVFVRTVMWGLLNASEFIGWYVGWPIFRLLTLGKFPKAEFSRPEKERDLTVFFVEGFGFVFVVFLGTLLAKLILATDA